MAGYDAVSDDDISGRVRRAGGGLFARIGSLLSGGVLVLVAGLIAFSIYDHNPLDPSWNVAASGPVTHALGQMGANIADLFLQTLGWAAGGIALVLGGWGVMKMTRPVQPRSFAFKFLRVSAAGFAILGFALAVSALPIPETWPFATGLGGIIGDGLLFTLTGPLESLGVPGAMVIAAVIGLAFATLGVFFTFGLRPSDVVAAADTASLAWATVRVWIDSIAGRIPWREGDSEARRSEDMIVAPKPRTRRPSAEPAVKVAPTRKRKASGREAREAQGALPFAESKGFKLPRLDLLARPKARTDTVDAQSLQQNAELLQGVLEDFGVRGEIGQVRPGPVVTLYEFEPAAGVKSSRVINLADDIARSMSATAARVAVVPGKNAIGIELPNPTRETVFLRALFNSNSFETAKAELPLALGETIGGEPFVADLARMPHLLIAGTTGSGKSVGINAMILSLLYRLPPEDCRLIMIDPKMLELSVYDGIPHLLSPVVTDPKKAVAALKWTVREMESRYLRMSKIGVRNIAGFNERVAEANANNEPLERTVQVGYDRETGEPLYETETIDAVKMPYIVLVIDEMADLMMVAGKEIEGAVQRLAQMARAAGIHMITATQRPSVDVITGTIKANFPTRISYQVTSKIDSRTILGEQGAEQLLGMGDLLFMAGGGRIRRLHGPFVSDQEVEDVAAYLKKQGTPEYLEEVTEESDDGPSPFEEASGGSGDDLFDQAVAVVARDRKASTSYIQRRLQIGYNRAATLIERMEDEGMIGPADHAGKREIFLPDRDVA
ncbi:DNA translocase FtsK 4TM domain-containing protein [Hyphobacterium sp. HN65]|uniref:DNA translocase FtsK n=1 Tax=Hyphobacterium lacteum TaxID=3116575 RepID=A0ABU7LST0_9PROT|nr:DNA translocase FtsK 4TM domain-containing protein [Hyphobacterium sp. HN65]MEE2526956.1 DNA translocase FtsK 4TM domain-containing protein [Hyphobacterium sp. HN65]